MAADMSIDDLLKEDENRLKEKRKRLNSFSKTLEESRREIEKARTAALEIIEAGDLTRSDLTKVFALDKNERALLIPPARQRRAKSLTTESPVEPTQPEGQSDNAPANPYH